MAAGLITASVGLFTQTQLAGMLREATSVTAVQIDNVNAIRSGIWEGETYKRGTFLASSFGDAALRVRMERDFDRTMTGIWRRIEASRAHLRTEEEQRSFSAVAGEVKEWENLVRQFIALSAQGKHMEVGPLVAKIVPLVDRLNRSSEELAGIYRSRLARAQEEAAEATGAAKGRLAALACMLLVCGLASFFMVRSVTASLGRKVGGLLSSLIEGSRQLASVSAGIASSSQTLSRMASEQAATLEETSASTQQLQEMTARNAENARVASTKTAEVGAGLEYTDASLRKMIVSMDAIVESSGKISRIIKVIDEIAFQTNILALNAAVEAARAGEAGMGFAVVADEVRNLAQRCAQAARDTTGLIEESIQTSQEGKARVDRVAASVAAVSKEAAAVKLLAGDLNQGSGEQASGIRRIASAVSGMDRVTQQVAAHSEEGAAAAGQLSMQAAQVDEVVRQLAALAGGAGRRAA